MEVNHSYPVLLHFNGNGLEKHKLDAVVRRLSWPNETTQADVWSSYVRDADRAVGMLGGVRAIAKASRDGSADSAKAQPTCMV